VSVTIYGRHDGDVIFEDDNGWASIPVRVLPVISYACIRREADGAAWAGRFFDRDVLLALRGDLDANALHELDTCTADGCEEAAPFNLRDTRPRCARHATEES
jgi:hypothetical protein